MYIYPLLNFKFSSVLSSNKFISLFLFATLIKERYGYNTGKLSKLLLTESVNLNKNQYAVQMYQDLAKPITDINVEYSPKLKLYALANGNTIPVKIDKKTYARQPLKRGDIVKVIDQYRKNKMKKVDGKWVESDEKEWWIREYKVC